MAKDFTQGSVGKALLLFSIPMIVGMMLQTAYNLIDAIFIGMLGAKEIAAVSITFPVVFVFIAIASGIGIGANALISQAIGKKQLGAANNFAEHALVMGAGMGIVIAVLGIIFSPFVFGLMGADAEILPLAIMYSTPIFIGLIFMFVWFVSDSILRAQGNSKAPMKSLAISVILNIILDPLLIFGFGAIPAMGLVGAAYATVFSRIAAALLNFLYIYSPKSTISLSFKEFKANPECIKSMLGVGLPASASQTLTAGGFILLMGIVGSFGSFAIAAFGIGLRIVSVAIMPMVGISSAVASFTGQNFGAGNFDRIIRVSLLARRMTLAIAVLIFAVVFFFPEQIMGIFTQDRTVISLGRTFLSIVPFMFVLYGGYFAFYGAFQGSGKTQYVLVTNFVYWATIVVVAFILSQTMGLKGVWLGFVFGASLEFVLITGLFVSRIWLKPNKKIEKAFCKPSN